MKRYIKSAIHLITDEPWDDQMKWALNDMTDSRTLDQLSHSDDVWIRDEVASNPNISSDTLRRLSEDPNPGIRGTIAGNPNTPVDILYTLLNDSDRNVRMRLSRNPNCPADIVSALSRDSEPIVKYELLCSSVVNVSKEDVMCLCNDPNPSVATLAKYRAKSRGYV